VSKSWPEVRSVLDDPYVSADTKEALLAAYVQENRGPFGLNDLPDEIQDYTDGTKASYKVDYGDYQAGRFMGTDHLYQEAQDESEEKGYQADLNDGRVENGRTTIEGMQPPVEGSSAGVQTSNEIFDAARNALKIFEDFVPINDKVPGDCLYQKINLDTDIKKRYDEQMGISFKNFLDDAKRLRDAHTELSELNGNTETQLNSLYREWTGPAANASYQYYSEKMTPNVTDLLEYLQTAPDMINTAVENIFTACKDKANDVIQLYQSVRGTVGSATPHIADQVVKLAKGDFSSQDEVLEVAAWVDSVCGGNLESTIRADDCGLNDENKEYVIRECKKWIRDSFNTDLHENLYANFKQACDDAFDLVNTHYESLNTYLKEYENKFGGPLASQQQPPPTGDGNNNGDGGNNENGGGSSTGNGTGGGGGTGGGTGGGGGMPAVPEVPPTTTTPAGDETDPNADDPTAQPPSTTPTQDQQETVTIKDGEREIGVTSPDGQGMVKVTVDDGSGKPKTYTLDFGGPDAAGTPGQPGTPGTPGTPGDAAVAPGENGAPPTAPGPDAPIEPGPDGKCVITDGELTITAERPEGQPDTVVVTVDDGTGNPTTYNLDYSESQTSGQPGGPQTVGGPDGPVTTLPAYGETPQGIAQPGTDMPQGVAVPADMQGAAPMPADMPQGVAVPADTQGAAPMPAEAQGVTQPGSVGPMPAESPGLGQPMPAVPAQGTGQPMPAEMRQGVAMPAEAHGVAQPGGMPQGTGQPMPAHMPQGFGQSFPADAPHGQPMPAHVPQGAGQSFSGDVLQGAGQSFPADAPHGQPVPAHMQGAGQAFPADGPPNQQHAFATSAAGADPGAMGGPHASGGAAGSFGVPDQQPSPYVDRPSGEASLAGAPDDPPSHPGQTDQSGHSPAQPGMGGMPMMGGGPAGGGSGDAERAATQWRTTGDLFDEPADPQRFRGAFGGGD
jgi:uncharacterized protein YukE